MAPNVDPMVPQNATSRGEKPNAPAVTKTASEGMGMMEDSRNIPMRIPKPPNDWIQPIAWVRKNCSTSPMIPIRFELRCWYLKKWPCTDFIHDSMPPVLERIRRATFVRLPGLVPFLLHPAVRAQGVESQPRFRPSSKKRHRGRRRVRRKGLRRIAFRSLQDGPAHRA